MLKKIFDQLNITKNTPLVIGCSAGPDSMALLHYIKENTPNPIIVAHVNHNLRKESQEEKKYLEKYCQKNHITFEYTNVFIDHKKNLENDARIKRYQFYETILKKYHTHYLFLAHHGDDLIETILMKIERGSNLEGYAGIKEISKPTQYHNYYIIRPFLTVTKQDLLDYNKNNNIKYYIDQSNEDMTYTRNRYRKNILPQLKKEKSTIHKQYLKYSKTLLEYTEYINEITTEQKKRVWKNNSLELETFKQTHHFIQKQILYKILNDYYQNQPNIIKEKHIEKIQSIINSQKPNLTYNLPHQIIIRKSYNKLYIEKEQPQQKEKYKIEFHKKITTNNFIIEEVENSLTDGNDICRLNLNNITLPLYIRNRKEGDTILLKGLNKHKKVKEILIEAKIPQHLRDNYPILTDANDNILWIPNIKKSKFNTQNKEFCDIILKYSERKDYNE